VQRGAYRPKPSRRAYIPKSDGRKRPLGIAAQDCPTGCDGSAQRHLRDGFPGSYGFRPGRRAHVALDALAIGIRFKKIGWILDADIRNYFGDWALRFLGHRIADYKDARSHAEVATGVLEEGEWAASEEGTPQGASRSPLLANIYLHYTLDLWVQPWRKRPAAM